MLTDTVAARVVDVDKTYRTKIGSVPALRAVTAEFPSGSLTAVAGPSGSGKSSLLRLLAALDRSSSGSVHVAGVRLESARRRTLRRIRSEVVGYVFQRPSDNFIPRMTVDEHLRMAAASSKGSPILEATDLLEILGIAGRRDHLPAELSGGEQQRAAFAQVLMAGVSVVVADEPTAELDSISAGGVLDTISSLTGLGLTFILATHDPVVMERADGLVRLEYGRVVSAPSRWSPAGQGARSQTLPQLRRFDPPEVVIQGSGEAVPVLEMQQVSKAYRRGQETVHALRDVSISVYPGEFVGLVGRSGSGKTTLLNVAGGWEQQDSGRVSFSGRDPTQQPPRWHEVSVVPQKLGLMEELTIRENVEYPARLAGRLEGLTRFVDDLVEALGLRELQHRYPPDTSVGEQQRAALARALILSPRLILTDEPTSHQDRDWERAVLAALRRSIEDGSACLAATHGAGLASSLDRTLSLSDGRAVERIE